MAEIKSQRNIAKAVTTLVRMIEHNMDPQGVLVILQQEIDYLNNYLYLQNLRYTNNIDMVFAIEESLEKAAILWLSLQQNQPAVCQ